MSVTETRYFIETYLVSRIIAYFTNLLSLIERKDLMDNVLIILFKIKLFTIIYVYI